MISKKKDEGLIEGLNSLFSAICSLRLPKLIPMKICCGEACVHTKIVGGFLATCPVCKKGTVIPCID